MSISLTARCIPLPNGLEIPQIGLGTWPLKGPQATHAVRSAIELGYRLIDTAEAYENEEAVGEGLRSSGVAREQLFITTKLNREWHSRAGVRQACEASLRRLRTSYIDLFLIHWPNPRQDRYVEAFEAMMELVEAGLIRSAGVSNFKPQHLERLLALDLHPQLNQIQLDPYRPRVAEVDFHQKHRIVTESWSPLDRDGGLLREGIVARIAQELSRSAAQVVLRWHVQKGFVTVPKSGDPRRQRDNLDIFNFELTAAHLARLDALADNTARIEDSDIVGH